MLITNKWNKNETMDIFYAVHVAGARGEFTSVRLLFLTTVSTTDAKEVSLFSLSLFITLM